MSDAASPHTASTTAIGDRQSGEHAGAPGRELADRTLPGRHRGGRRDVDAAGEVLGDRHADERGHGIGIESAGDAASPRSTRATGGT